MERTYATKHYPRSIERQVIEHYRRGLSFVEIGAQLAIDRHCVPHILTRHGEALRLPWQGSKSEWSKVYEKTPKGFLMRTYRNMQSRVAGVQKKSVHLYKGLPILPRNDFYAWAWNNADFWRLYKDWAGTEYDRRLTPSINRINTYEGYLLGNIEWLTMSVNSALGGSSPKRKLSKAKQSLNEVFAHATA